MQAYSSVEASMSYSVIYLKPLFKAETASLCILSTGRHRCDVGLFVLVIPCFHPAVTPLYTAMLVIGACMCVCVCMCTRARMHAPATMISTDGL